MRIDSEQLAQHLNRELAALYVIVGEEPLLALEAGDRLRIRAKELGFSERTLLVVESGFDWGSLGAAAASLSLFAERRLIELRIPNGRPGTAGAAAIERYCQALAPDTVTIVHLPAMDWKAMQAGWFQALEASATLVEARSVERSRLPRWLAGRMARNGQSVDEAGLQFIAERVEGNLLAAWQEVQKLALLFPAGKLAASEVRKAVLDVARFEVDDVSAALLAGDAAHYVRVLDHLEAEGAALPLILWSITSDLRAAYSIGRALERGVAPAGALREARVFGARRAAMERAARRWSASQLESALLRSARIDRLIKGLGGGSAWDELRELGLGLTLPAARPGPASTRRVAV
jgi:DNA polymerase-3 subunit delta